MKLLDRVRETLRDLRVVMSRYKYSALPDEPGYGPLQKNTCEVEPRVISHKRIVNLVAVFMMATMFVLGAFYVAAFGSTAQAKICDTPDRGYQCFDSISHYWGQYAPFFAIPSAIDPAIPPSCKITFAQVLSRHGSRDPTASAGAGYNTTIAKIHASVTKYGAGYEFIQSYKYSLGADDLTPFGQQEMVNSGIEFYNRYEALAKTVSPYVRSSGQQRVVVSAENFTQGFHAQRLADKKARGKTDTYPYDILVIPEAAGVNNTLNHELCTQFETGKYSNIGNNAQTAWKNVFLPNITARLNTNLPGANLSFTDTINMMDLCPFNTVASINGSTLSAFCNLFTEAEWHQYDYYETLGKWYGYGLGNPLGSTQGVGFTNELIARLTDSAVVDHTSTNRTLDSSPATFPLGRQLYADFSHDNDMTAIFAALGLYNRTAQLSNTTVTTPRQAKGFSAGWTVPFGARMYVEKMECSNSGKGKELVRIVVNGRVVPLQGCAADGLGRCELGKFVDGLSFARGGGRWDLCFT